MTQWQPPALMTGDHDIQHFHSGEWTLDQWLKKRALNNQQTGASRTFVLCKEKKVVGYYCLSAGAVNHDIAPKKLQRNMPKLLPILLLGRLAIDKDYHNQGLGSALLRDALIRACHVANQAGVYALLVHAISDTAKKFYLSKGFIESPLQPFTLMIKLETAKDLLHEKTKSNGNV